MENKIQNTTTDEQLPPESDESNGQLQSTISATTDEPNDEMKKETNDNDRQIVREKTIASWQKKIEQGADFSNAPEWVIKKINAQKNQSNAKVNFENNLSEFKKAISNLRIKLNLSENEFNAKYGDSLNKEINTLLDYGLPSDVAFKKAASIVGIRSMGDQRRERQKFLGNLPPKSNLNPKFDSFYLIPVEKFDTLSSSEKRKYMKNSQEEYGEVVFS